MISFQRCVSDFTWVNSMIKTNQLYLNIFSDLLCKSYILTDYILLTDWLTEYIWLTWITTASEWLTHLFGCMNFTDWMTNFWLNEWPHVKDCIDLTDWLNLQDWFHLHDWLHHNKNTRRKIGKNKTLDLL